MNSFLLLSLLAVPDDSALEAKLKRLRAGDIFTHGEQLPTHFAPWRVRQIATASGKPDCRAYAFLLEGDGSTPWVALTIFCGKALIRSDEMKEFVDWPIMADFESCSLKLRLAAVNALSARADVFWLSETAVCDGDLLAEEFIYEPNAGRLTRQLKAVCADPAAGKTAVETYKPRFEGRSFPKAFSCNSIRFTYRSGEGYRSKYD